MREQHSSQSSSEKWWRIDVDAVYEAHSGAIVTTTSAREDEVAQTVARLVSEQFERHQGADEYVIRITPSGGV